MTISLSVRADKIICGADADKLSVYLPNIGTPSGYTWNTKSHLDLLLTTSTATNVSSAAATTPTAFAASANVAFGLPL
jgi:hypothetical protein